MISKILFILASYIFLACLECVKSYTWSFGHSDPDPKSVFYFLPFFLGGLEAFEEKLRLEEEEKEAAKQRELDRRQEISKKTRSRLSELLDRKRAEVLLELER